MKQYRLKTHELVEWQQENYDADCSDLDDSSEMPRPVWSFENNYPIEELELDLEYTLEFLKSLRTAGTLLPEDVVKAKKIMKLFQHNMNIVLESANFRYLPVTATCENKKPDSEQESNLLRFVPSCDSEISGSSSTENEFDVEYDIPPQGKIQLGTGTSTDKRYTPGYHSLGSDNWIEFGFFFGGTILKTRNETYKYRRKGHQNLRMESTVTTVRKNKNMELEFEKDKGMICSGSALGTENANNKKLNRKQEKSDRMKQKINPRKNFYEIRTRKIGLPKPEWFGRSQENIK